MTQCTTKQFSFLCFGGEDWWYHNRGHIDMQMIRRFAGMGQALYVNSLVMQKPNFKKGTGGGRSLSQKIVRKVKSISRGLVRTEYGFSVYSPLSLPLHHLSWGRAANRVLLTQQLKTVITRLGMHQPIVWVACPTACDAAIDIDSDKIVYQRTDRFEDYPNVDGKTISTFDRRLKEVADITVYVNEQLYRDELDQCQRSLYLDHGVDYEFFADALNDPMVPCEYRGIPRPIAGFFGGIDSHTSDISLLEKVVKLTPDMSFVFVGRVSSDVRTLKEYKNVWFFGQRDYSQIPHYGKMFDVAFMPWNQNRWIEACNPIKLKEYLALGKPIVSTPFPELKKYEGLVYVADSASGFSQMLTTAYQQDDSQKKHLRQQRVQNASWQSKARMILEILYENQTA